MLQANFAMSPLCHVASRVQFTIGNQCADPGGYDFIFDAGRLADLRDDHRDFLPTRLGVSEDQAVDVVGFQGAIQNGPLRISK